jgi:hypothetical protein
MRIQPQLPASAMKTYAVRQPLTTHYRPATCAEVECEASVKGWNSALDTTNPEHAKAATWIRMQSGRAFTVIEAGPVVTFHFPPGQQCFRKHQVPLERPQIFVVREGDFRGNPRGVAAITRAPADWVDDFANHQQTLADRLAQG